MSIIKNIFQNFRKPKNSFMGRCIVKMMNQGHNRISLWCIDNFVKLSVAKRCSISVVAVGKT